MADMDVDQLLMAALSFLKQIEDEGALGLPKEKRRMFLFHMTQAKQAICNSSKIIDPMNLNLRRLIQAYDVQMKKIMEDGGSAC